jgi:hypothetical protein
MSTQKYDFGFSDSEDEDDDHIPLQQQFTQSNNTEVEIVNETDDTYRRGGEDGFDEENELEQDNEEDDQSFETERAVGARVSNLSGDEAGFGAENNPRMFYAIRNMNRSDQDIFLDTYEKYCYMNKLECNRQGGQFRFLLENHPHPKFLNIPLCIATLEYFDMSSRKYRWNVEIYNRNVEKNSKYKELDPIDIYRYISLFNLYA